MHPGDFSFTLRQDHRLADKIELTRSCILPADDQLKAPIPLKGAL